jgi:DNA-binding transcriptional regulator YhcF (GntR family)
VVEVRHGAGVFVAGPQSSSAKSTEIRKAGEVLRTAMEKGMALGLSEAELRRAFEEELSRLQEKATARRRRT